MPRTIKELAQEAYDVQDACNLTGVVHAFSRAMTDLREIARAEGWESTEKLNTHPIVVMWSSKVESLCGSRCTSEFIRAIDWVNDMIGPKHHCS
jgi:hypothetical protein